MIYYLRNVCALAHVFATNYGVLLAIVSEMFHKKIYFARKCLRKKKAVLFDALRTLPH